MPATKAQQKAVTKYMKENYDEIKVRLKKGRKSVIKKHAAIHDGGSVNRFIIRAINETIEREAEEIPNAETLAAMKEVEEMVRSGSGQHFSGSTEDFIAMLLAEDD